jgi:competence protein ComEA
MPKDRKEKRTDDRGGWQPLVRHADQAGVAALVAAALVGMGVYWVVAGGPQGKLIEIDRAEPLVARFQVDINAAEWPELAQVPALGETLARRIVDSRLKEGAFGDHEDLLRVQGIGPRTLERMKPYLMPMPSQRNVAGDGVSGAERIP